MAKRVISLVISILLLMTVSLSVTTVAYADTSSKNNTVFSISDGDISKIFLDKLFGTVGDSGVNGDNKVMPKIFRALNSVILGLGSIVVIFTLLVSTLNSAHEGSALGKAWGSYWIPVRTALGIGALLPVQAGYSLLQACIMWILLHGVGAADYLWSVGATAALNTPMDATPAALATDGVEEAANIFRVLVCMHAVNKITSNGSSRIIINPSLSSPPLEKDKKYHYKVGSTREFNGIDEDACGDISWSKDSDETLGQARLDAVRVLIGSLSISALNLVEFGPNYVNLADLVNAATSYTNIVNQALLNKKLGEEDRVQQLLEHGWMLAGAFYYDMVQQNNEFKANQELPNTKDNSKNIGIGSDQSLVNRHLSNADKYISEAESEAGLDAAAGEGVSIDFKAFNISPDTGDEDASASISQGLGALEQKLNFVVGWWQGFFSESDADPLLSIQSAGKTIVQGIEIIWISTALIAAAIGVASICPALNPIFSILQNFVRWFVPMFTALLTFLFLSGSILAYYLPLIPFILFSFGALGWLFGVIEAMVAAPIIALGVVYAGGDQTLGKSEPAIMLLADLVLRPALMIVGLLAAIVMVRIGVRYINLGFSLTSGNVFAGGISYLTSVVALICIYSILIVTTVQLCFKLIYLIPNRVMRWIGGQPDAFESGEQSEQETRSGTEKGHEEFGKLGSAAATSSSTMDNATNQFGASDAIQDAQDSQQQQGLQSSQSGGKGGGGNAASSAEEIAVES